MRTTVVAKTQLSSITAVAYLEVGFGFPLQQVKGRFLYLDDAAIRTTGHDLTICAMTDYRSVGIRLSFKNNIAAVTTTVDGHRFGHSWTLVVAIRPLLSRMPAPVSRDFKNKQHRHGLVGYRHMLQTKVS
jgi:hypothetical protein